MAIINLEDYEIVNNEIDIDIEDFIDEIDTDDLIEELSNRKYMPEVIKSIDARFSKRESLINFLKLHPSASLEDVQEAVRIAYYKQTR